MLKILLGFESWNFFFLFIYIYTYIDLWKICGGGRWKATGNGAALFFLIPAREDIFIDTSFDGFPFICILVFFCWLKTALPEMCDAEGRITEAFFNFFDKSIQTKSDSAWCIWVKIFLLLLSSYLKRRVDEHGSTGFIWILCTFDLGFSPTLAVESKGA